MTAPLGALPSHQERSGFGSAEGRRYPEAIWATLILGFLAILTAALYGPGLGGGFVFDDYPNIVDNPMVQPGHPSLGELSAAALSSPSSELKRPLASLSFALNFLATGLDARAMKSTNIAIHIANGWLLFAFVLTLLRTTHPTLGTRHRLTAAGAVALAWLTLPINLTAVLYVVQRMESAAQLCVMAGLIGYLSLRRRMLQRDRGAVALGIWIAATTVVGVGFKETAVLLPLYAWIIEWTVFGFRDGRGLRDRRIVALFAAELLAPMVAGLAIIVPRVLSPEVWATRDFTLTTRLLSEPRVLVDYLIWIVLPTPQGLSFYHEDFLQSMGWLTPWTTLPAVLFVIGAICAGIACRKHRPLMALGILWYFACHSLTATVLPLELIYEHRNYPASVGVLLVLCDLLLPWIRSAGKWPRVGILAAVGLWIMYGIQLTAVTAHAWGSPLTLAQELANRAKASPRAQYEFGRALIIESHYEQGSPLIDEAREVLERAAILPGSSILPEQALIFLNSRMSLPLADSWWNGMYAKLQKQRATVQDDSSLLALEACARSDACNIPPERLKRAFELAARDGNGSARLIGGFAQLAWSELGDRVLALRLSAEAVAKAPEEPAYRVNYANFLISTGNLAEARRELVEIRRFNVAGRLNKDIEGLQSRIGDETTAKGSKHP